ncbi:MAG: hypothetical protein GY898_32090 [Proteobacteria bacterium]|nr:hypothetical protein [Pseudomonadota bacterium]
MSPEAGPTCAVHADKASVGTCEHCGTFSCGACLGWIGNKKICATCVREGRVTVFGVPWDQRAELGLARAWFRTATMMFAHPVEFFRKLDPYGPLGEAFLFAAISGGIVSLLFTVLSLLFGALLGLGMLFDHGPGIGGAEGLLALVIMLVSIGGMFIVMPPLTLLIGNCVWALIHHGSMRLVGGGTAGLAATLRVCLFGSAYQTIQWIPCILLCSPLNLATTIWYLVMWGIGYTQTHEQDGWKSAVGIILPGLMCCISYIGFYVIIIFLDAL